MRTTLCVLALLLIAGVANAAEPPMAVDKGEASCKLASVTNASENVIDFGAISASERTKSFCFLWKRNRYYTDATYSTLCSTRSYYCDGTVGTSGLCNPPSPYLISEELCTCDE